MKKMLYQISLLKMMLAAKKPFSSPIQSTTTEFNEQLWGGGGVSFEVVQSRWTIVFKCKYICSKSVG